MLQKTSYHYKKKSYELPRHFVPLNDKINLTDKKRPLETEFNDAHESPLGMFAAPDKSGDWSKFEMAMAGMNARVAQSKRDGLELSHQVSKDTKRQRTPKR